LTQRVQCAVLSSGNRAGTRQFLPVVFKCTHRSPLGNRPTRHLAVAILVALGMGPPAPLTPFFSPTRSLESTWPPLCSLKSCLWSRTSCNRRSLRCSRGSGQGVGAQRRRRRRGWRANDSDHHGLWSAIETANIIRLVGAPQEGLMLLPQYESTRHLARRVGRYYNSARHTKLLYEHSEQARAPHTNGPRDVPGVGL
jgi:hypothetical protein